MESKSVRDKVVIVTGAAKGIGLAIAKRFGAEGAVVVVADINAEGAGSASESIIATGGRAIAVTTDVSDEEQVNALFDQVLERFGTVDVLVNNAALVVPNRHFLEADKQWWDGFIAVNLTGSFLCGLRAAQFHNGTVDVLVNNAALVVPNRHFLEADKQWWDGFIAVNLTGSFLCGLRAAQIMAHNGKGSIINLSSGGATRAHRAFVAYDATKGGIEAMTRAMSLDLGP